jgi:transcriptional regulator with XRE-family HTH domain
VKQDWGAITRVNNLALHTFGDRIRHAREALGLSQADLAKAVGLKPGAIGNYESGSRDSSRKLATLAKVLDVRAEWLEAGIGPMRADPLERTEHFPSAQSKLRQKDALIRRLAHAVSDRQPIVTPKTIVWEDLVSATIEGQFLLAVKGEALMPTYPPGQMAIWQACDHTAANPGQAVLIQLPGGQFELRFMERRGSTWAGVSQRVGFGELQPERDQAKVVARLRYLDLG